ncbi:putative high affinity copper protein [Xylariaceae sp. FL1651]|nr:putative high affinity copper protein [Xylariaceae sp. FL1651]
MSVLSEMSATSTTTGHSTFDFTPPGTGPTSTASASAMDRMSGMNGDMDMMTGSCRISMLWNWETIDACFLSESWQIHSHGGFAGLCIAVILLVILLEFLRRVAKTYDRHLVRRHQKAVTLAASSLAAAQASNASGALIVKDHQNLVRAAPFRPNVFQQTIRALLHTLQFSTAYWIMLLAMYYNGYIIICIFIGAFIGSFIFQWERLGPRSDGTAGTGTLQEPTGCCG